MKYQALQNDLHPIQIHSVSVCVAFTICVRLVSLVHIPLDRSNYLAVH